MPRIVCNFVVLFDCSVRTIIPSTKYRQRSLCYVGLFTVLHTSFYVHRFYVIYSLSRGRLPYRTSLCTDKRWTAIPVLHRPYCIFRFFSLNSAFSLLSLCRSWSEIFFLYYSTHSCVFFYYILLMLLRLQPIMCMTCRCWSKCTRRVCCRVRCAFVLNRFDVCSIFKSPSDVLKPSSIYLKFSSLKSLSLVRSFLSLYKCDLNTNVFIIRAACKWCSVHCLRYLIRCNIFLRNDFSK